MYQKENDVLDKKKDPVKEYIEKIRKIEGDLDDFIFYGEEVKECSEK